MSENHLPPSSYPEFASDIPENESTAVNYDWTVPGYSQPPALGGLVSSDHIPGYEDPLSLSLTHPSDRSVNRKVAIPRSAQPSTWTSSGRVSRACENCREQKAKCSGHRPACHRCQDAGVQCSYGDRKREKMLKQLSDLTTQVNTYDNLLRELYPRLDSSSAQHVDQVLGSQFVALTSQNVQQQSGSPSGPRIDFGVLGNPLATIDHTEEDFNRDGKVQATGFVGEHSDMAWLYRLKRDLDQDNSDTPVGEASDRPSISSLNYFQDDMKISVLDNSDLLTRPAQHIADKLVDDYFQSVHPAFPVIGKELFLGQYRSFYLDPNVRPRKRWLAVLNLVFAIAAKHSLLVENQLSLDPNDHLVFFARAWRLSMGNVALLDHPDLQQVQVEGLAAFYLLTTGQINRSWRIIGIAVRSAMAMGLNLRSETDSVAHLSKETRYRVWWALFMLDTVLSVITGRPPSTGAIFCTTPLPLPYREEEFRDENIVQLITDQSIRNTLMSSLLASDPISSGSSETPTDRTSSVSSASGKTAKSESSQPISETPPPNTSLYFLYVVDLAFLIREAIETLYAPGSTRRSWLEMEIAIETFNNNADKWLSRLPVEFHFTDLDSTRPFARQRASLAFRFYSTKLIITQPCLRRLTSQRPGVSSPGAVCDTMAALCVHIAIQAIDLLPDSADAPWLYDVSPWWCVLHYLMQSTTVLLMELFTRTDPGTPEAASLIEKIEKATRWLRAMSTKDDSSRRAWLVCMELLSRHGRKFGLNVNVGL